MEAAFRVDPCKIGNSGDTPDLLGMEATPVAPTLSTDSAQPAEAREEQSCLAVTRSAAKKQEVARQQNARAAQEDTHLTSYHLEPDVGNQNDLSALERDGACKTTPPDGLTGTQEGTPTAGGGAQAQKDTPTAVGGAQAQRGTPTAWGGCPGPEGHTHCGGWCQTKETEGHTHQ